MRLIDVDKFKQRIKNSTASKPTKVASLVLVDTQETIDPVHFAGGCYCKECLHSEPVEYKFADDWIVPIDEYWCNEHKINMPLNGFCSEGRKDDMKND